jgi:hypothetical protein
VASVTPERPAATGRADRSILAQFTRPVSTHGAGIDIDLNPRRLTDIFAALVVLLVIVHVTVQTLRFTFFDGGSMGGLVGLFNLGTDGNLPTFYSSFALLFCSLLLLATALATHRSGEGDGGYWLGLAAIFAFLSVDEMLELHERLIEPVRDALGTGGLLYYAWVIPYSLGGVALLIVYRRFLRRLPRRTAILFLVSGVTFVAGAVGMEMLGGLYFERYGSQHPGYVALQTLEETLEMSGVVLFIYAIATHLVCRYGRLTLRLGPAPRPSRRAAASTRLSAS